MTYLERKAELKKNLELLKEDVKILQNNMIEFEEILETINSDEDLKKHSDFDIEKGLRIIELM